MWYVCCGPVVFLRPLFPPSGREGGVFRIQVQLGMIQGFGLGRGCNHTEKRNVEENERVGIDAVNN